MRVTESGVELSVPDTSTDGVEAAVFYNPDQVLNRDLTVATLRALSNSRPGLETYLDGMTASGIRGIRAALDGWRVTCCDVDERAVKLARENLRRNDCTVVAGEGSETAVGVIEGNVNAVLHDSAFDVVDLDPFGTPMPYADAAFAGTREVLCVTATDTAPLCGAHMQSGIRKYGAVPRNTEYHPEMGVRVLLAGLARSGARFDVGVRPLLTHATDHYVRTYLDLDHRATAADAALEELGHVDHCPECLYREWERGLIASPRDACPNCDSTQVVTAGPIWLGHPHDRSFLATVREHVPERFDTASNCRSLLETLRTELPVPTHYDQHRLCKRWGRTAASMDAFLGRLADAGHPASRTHYGGTTFKTEATVAEIKAATRANDST